MHTRIFRASAALLRRTLTGGAGWAASAPATAAGEAEPLVEALLPHAGQARRLGVSGAPGVGKPA